MATGAVEVGGLPEMARAAARVPPAVFGRLSLADLTAKRYGPPTSVRPGAVPATPFPRAPAGNL